MGHSSHSSHDDRSKLTTFKNNIVTTSNLNPSTINDVSAYINTTSTNIHKNKSTANGINVNSKPPTDNNPGSYNNYILNSTNQADNNTYHKTNQADNNTYHKTNQADNNTYHKTNQADNNTYHKTNQAYNNTYTNTDQASNHINNGSHTNTNNINALKYGGKVLENTYICPTEPNSLTHTNNDEGNNVNSSSTMI